MDIRRQPHYLGARSRILFLAAVLFATSPFCEVQAQTNQSPPPLAPAQTKISVTTELVILPVNVTDSKGAFIPGLGIQNFQVYEDGRLQRITFFSEEDTPVTVGLIVDHSRSMVSKLPEIVSAVSTFAHSSNPDDEMFVVDFSDKVTIKLFGGKDFTSDARDLERAVSAVSARGRTALYDAIADGLKHLQLGHRDKKALIIVSDGGDNASAHKYSDVLFLARQSHAAIYSIGLIGESHEEENPRVLERLCKDTGGIAFFPHAGESTSNIAKEIARDLREQYTLGYVPEKKPSGGSFRKIAVRVAAPGRGKVQVRTRAGYSVPAEKTQVGHSGGDEQ